MLLSTRGARLTSVVAAAGALAIGMAGTAQADTAGRPGDIVGVGSDTVQNAVNFIFDGAPGVTGAYNSLGGKNRVLSFDANGDANGRGVYDGTCGTTLSTGFGAGCETFSGTVATPNSVTQSTAPNLLAGSVILRESTKPVVRPNGSGAGAAALNADVTGYQGLPAGSIQFARMSRQPNSGEEGNCPTSNAACGGLHVYQIGTDHLGIAVRSANAGGTHAVPLSAAELVNIYNCTTTTWNALPGNSAGSTNTIHPLIPQSGSGTRNFFLAALASAAGTASFNPGTCVRTVQEHDPVAIYTDPSPADVVEPFSGGKIAMINNGYLANSSSGAAATPYTTSGGYLTLLSGTPGDSLPTLSAPVVNTPPALAAPTVNTPVSGTASGGALAASTQYFYEVTSTNSLGETTASTEVNVTTGASDNSVTVSWPAITGATGYKVYRSTATGTETFIASVAQASSPSLLDKGGQATSTTTPPTTNTTATKTTGGTLAGGTTYFYKVTATQAQGSSTGETLPSTEVSVAVPNTTNTNQVHVQWAQIAGASGYKVYRSTATGTETLLATLTPGSATSFNDTGALTPGSATPPTSNTTGGTSVVYNDDRQLFVVIRNADLGLTGASSLIQPGGTANWATFLFAGSASITPVIAKPAAGPLITAAGFTPAYGDCGVNPDPNITPVVCTNPF